MNTGRGGLALALAGGMLLVAGRAEAQAEITGNYIGYLGVRSNGAMINTANHSMRYRETLAGAWSCDVFYPGSPVHQFTVEATGTSNFRYTNDYGTTGIATTAGPTVAGRAITWSGQSPAGRQRVGVDLRYEYNNDDRVVTVTATLRNIGTVALSDVYFLMNGDPDQGQCVGGDFTTTNDVVYQPPADNRALAVAQATGTGGPWTIGVGAFDRRARAHVNVSGLTNDRPAATWSAPNDPNGTSADVGMSLVFREPSLAVGGSVTFRFFYVWGDTATTVRNRFNALSCSVLGDGSACLSGGAEGVCHAGACCTGCWDGSACQAGTSISACGRAGGACASCVDGNGCTTDTCTAGVCSNPPVPAGTACEDGLYCTDGDACNGAGTCVAGAARSCDDGLSCTADSCNEGADRCDNTPTAGNCAIGGVCYTDGTVNPANVCQACDTGASQVAWTPVAAGTACDDGLFCTDGDTCDGAGACLGGAPHVCDDGLDCTADRCDEGADRCDNTPTAGNCAIGGVCYPDGTVNPANVCQACDTGASQVAWTPVAAGTACDDGLFCTDGDTCDGAGACLGAPRVCDDGLDCTADSCDEIAGLCRFEPEPDTCAIGGACYADGAGNPADPCQGCVVAESQTAWSYLPGPTCDSDHDSVLDRDEQPGDSDGDTIPDYLDPDDDGDDIPTATEVADEAGLGGDVDGDTVPAYLDTDSDGEGELDLAEGTGDLDGDGVPNYLDPDTAPADTDGDTVIDTEECPSGIEHCGDTDGDTVVDYLDTDDDGDSVPTLDEHRTGDRDTDGDTVVDRLDPDDDGDGIPTLTEVEDVTELGGEPDDDAIPAYLDTDSDGDGMSDQDEGTGDLDGDGIPSYLDADEGPADTDGDGVPDSVECEPGTDPCPDTDGDTHPDVDDPDDDGDGLPTRDERPGAVSVDTDGDDTPDYLDLDDDGDGLPTRDERPGDEDRDTDGDTVPDYLDLDDDGDGIPTATEIADVERLGGEPDDDDRPAYLDTDSDGDGIPDATEGTDDDDGDGVPNYLDPNPPSNGGLAGGAGCGCTAPGGRGHGFLGLVALALLGGLVLARRRRRGGAGRGPGAGTAALAVGLLAAASFLAAPAPAAAQSVTLDNYRAAETPEDGFVLSRPTDRGHLQGSAQLHLDYAWNPLVYEQDLGDAGSESASIVEHQLVANLAATLGVWDRLVVFLGMPFNLVMTGEEVEGQPGADGTTLGDLYFGARVRLWGEPDDPFAVGIQVAGTAPTAWAAHDDEHFSGEGFMTFLPKILLEARPGAGVLITANFGARIREREEVTSLDIRHEFTWGLGVTVPLLEDTLWGLMESWGATTFESFGDREGSPVEALAGLRYQVYPDLYLGLAGGAGLTRGYGSPDMRWVLTFGWAQTAPAEPVVPPPPADRDGDTLLDDQDACPDQPEDVDRFADDDGCPDPDNDGDTVPDAEDQCPLDPGAPEEHGCLATVRVDREQGQIIILQRVEFATNEDRILRSSEPILHDVRRALEANPQIARVRVEGHTDSRGRDAHNLDLSRRRARSVIRWLVENGIEAGRLEGWGCGELHPIADNDTDAGRQTNRRVEFIILDPVPPAGLHLREGCQPAPVP